MKITLLATSILLILFTGCSSKNITVASLHPSKFTKKYETVYIERFLNDRVDQQNMLYEKVVNKVINENKVFKVKNDLKADVIISGEVLESFVYRTPYFDERIDYSRCIRYKDEDRNYRDKKEKSSSKKECIKYRVKRIPCEQRDYKVASKIDLFDTSDNSVLFSKVYSKSYSKDICYEYRHHHFPLTGFVEDEYEVNSRLASQIAHDILRDISPHYKYFSVEMMTDLDDDKVKYSDKQEEDFDKIIELMRNGHLKKAKENLEKFDARSVEGVYNLALIYENENKLVDANKLYNQAYEMTENSEYLTLIKIALQRTKINLEEKIKAKSQLP